MEREHGFQDEIRRRFHGIDIVGLQFGMASQAKSMAATENMPAVHPDLADIFADNESSTAEAGAGVEVPRGEKREAGGIRRVGPDSGGFLKNGFIDSLVVQNPFRMGCESTLAIGLKLSGQNPPGKIDSGARLIRKEDLEKEETKKFLFPDIGKYLNSDR